MGSPGNDHSGADGPFEEERRKKAVAEFEELMKRPGGLDAFEELVRDFRNRKTELRTVFRR